MIKMWVVCLYKDDEVVTSFDKDTETNAVNALVKHLTTILKRKGIIVPASILRSDDLFFDLVKENLPNYRWSIKQIECVYLVVDEDDVISVHRNVDGARAAYEQHIKRKSTIATEIHVISFATNEYGNPLYEEIVDSRPYDPSE